MHSTGDAGPEVAHIDFSQPGLLTLGPRHDWAFGSLRHLMSLCAAKAMLLALFEWLDNPTVVLSVLACLMLDWMILTLWH